MTDPDAATPAPAPADVPRRVLVAGASGFVGRRLCPLLVERGHEVVRDDPPPRDLRRGRASRSSATSTTPRPSPPRSRGATRRTTSCTPWTPRTSSGWTARRPPPSGRPPRRPGSGGWSTSAGWARTTTTCPPHLRSRREVEQLLGAAGVPVTTLRAGIVIGHQGLSWEMTRQLVERLPLMVTPRWVSTRTQPIALGDVVRYLATVLTVPETTGRALEVGGDEVLRYSEMMRRVAGVAGPPAVPAAGAAALAQAVLALAQPDHRRRRQGRPVPGRLHGQRGGRRRRRDPPADPLRPGGLRRRRARGPGRAGRGPRARVGPAGPAPSSPADVAGPPRAGAARRVRGRRTPSADGWSPAPRSWAPRCWAWACPPGPGPRRFYVTTMGAASHVDRGRLRLGPPAPGLDPAPGQQPASPGAHPGAHRRRGLRVLLRRAPGWPRRSRR